MKKMRFWLLLILLFTTTLAFAQSSTSEKDEDKEDLPDIELKDASRFTGSSTGDFLGIPGLTTGGAVGIAAAVIITAVVLSDMDGTTGTSE